MPPYQTARVEEITALVRRRLPEKTLAHSLSTAQTLTGLADDVKIDPDKAAIVGLLHDIHKPTSGAELLALAGRYGIPVTGVHRLKPRLLHGPVTAEECRRELGVDDEEIYEAIYWHTTGRANLGMLGLALFYADFAEPLRTHPEAPLVRAMFAKEGLWAAVRFVAAEKLQYARKKPPVDPNTEAFHAWLDERLR